MRKARNTAYQAFLDRAPMFRGFGLREEVKAEIAKTTKESLDRAFRRIIEISLAAGGLEASAIVLLDRWTGKLFTKEEMVRLSIPDDLADEGVVIDRIGTYDETQLVLPRLVRLPRHVQQVSVHTHPRADIRPSGADLATIQRRFRWAIDDAHFIISYDPRENVILWRQFKNVF